MAFSSTPLNLTERIALVSMADPALTREEPQYGHYKEAVLQGKVADPSLLCIREGEEATRFVCQPLSVRTLARVEDILITPHQGEQGVGRLSTAFVEAFRYGVLEVENLDGLARPLRRDGKGRLREDDLNTLGLPLDVLVEIGGQILARSRLDAETKKKS